MENFKLTVEPPETYGLDACMCVSCDGYQVGYLYRIDHIHNGRNKAKLYYFESSYGDFEDEVPCGVDEHEARCFNNAGERVLSAQKARALVLQQVREEISAYMNKKKARDMVRKTFRFLWE